MTRSEGSAAGDVAGGARTAIADGAGRSFVDERADGVASAPGAPATRDSAARQAPTFIAPGATLGVVGGGQLGRMFVQAAARMGYRTAVLDPDRSSPAGLLAHDHVVGAYDDADALAAFAERCAAVTTEFENVPAATLETLAGARPVAPAARAVAVCQDRVAEKAAFVRAGIACAPHAAIVSRDDLVRVDPGLFPAILKTARLGYDGKGQRAVERAGELAAAFDALGGVPCVLEKRLSLAAEVSVVVARGAEGDVVRLPVQENVHVDGILAVTRVPARSIDDAQAAQAIEAATALAGALDYVGVLCVEFFVDRGGALVANEMAPRPHNSGHHSLDSCDVSQFELQVRTLVGAPLVPPRLHSAAVMLNLLGELWARAGSGRHEPDWARVLGLPGAHLHLYGKAEARAGRKMGHLTFTAADPRDAEDAARRAADALGLRLAAAA